jgi:hypothetical protein
MKNGQTYWVIKTWPKDEPYHEEMTFDLNRATSIYHRHRNLGTPVRMSVVVDVMEHNCEGF